MTTDEIFASICETIKQQCNYDVRHRGVFSVGIDEKDVRVIAENITLALAAPRPPEYWALTMTFDGEKCYYYGSPQGYFLSAAQVEESNERDDGSPLITAPETWPSEAAARSYAERYLKKDYYEQEYAIERLR